MDKLGGYILLFKQMQDNWLWTDKPFARGQAWIDLLLMANFKDGTMVCKGTIVEIGRGQVFRTVKFLSERWGWSIKKTKNFLHLLESQEMVSLEGLPQGTRITIEKYNDYQLEGPSKGLSEVYTGDQPGTTEGLQKNKERIKKKKKEDIYSDVPSEIKDVFMEWAEMRKKIKKPLTSKRAVTMALNALTKLTEDPAEQIKLIEYAIYKNWQSFYPIDKQEKPVSVYQPEPPKYPEFKPEPDIQGEQATPEQMAEMYAKLGGCFG